MEAGSCDKSVCEFCGVFRNMIFVLLLIESYEFWKIGKRCRKINLYCESQSKAMLAVKFNTYLGQTKLSSLTIVKACSNV